jgi:hypothetical protein
MITGNARILGSSGPCLRHPTRGFATWAGDGITGSSFALSGDPYLETFLVHVLAAGRSAVCGVFGTFESREADGAVSLDRLPIPFSGLYLSFGVNLNRWYVLEDLFEFGW